jgi:uncharacterized protein YndB with AHSA1/START domain
MNKTIHFSTLIEAPRQTVWDVMLEPETYKIWAAEFAEGSYFEGSWEEGARIRFLAADGQGGMTSVIAENRPLERISIRHLGMIQNGVEDTESEEVRAWAPVYESYTFSDSGSATELKVDMDVAPDWEGYMLETWPKALARLKALCEERQGQK